ncbi:hypothetical protein A8L34_28190 [Bacillus sp. FJAT-27264]|uniref:type II toxin-antitoxin system PemK/MazF family toxin n=1 Tax=Paenibacillus sp. (strain DSM 101736 / FJAT-27264) TaxID=1850362 RepID=UPI000807CB00|nr:type II toxin-antitoxin system PemK/MazF family toxin [Bacillus sp. FJAT-27264]OBZ15929.1 hypothetical protein A8L34_28190 [Bacillus sp. FJAT-27264]
MIKNFEGLYGINDFRRGEVYWCEFPQKDLLTPQPLAAPDYNLYGKHMAVMLTDHNNPNVPKGQALVVPISTIQSLNGKDPFVTYIPLKIQNNPYLEHNSFTKTNQVQPIDRRWIKEKIGRVDQNDMTQINIGVMVSTGTYKYMEQYIDQHVTKRVLEALSGRKEVAATVEEPLPRTALEGGIQQFRRGDVVKCLFPLTRRARAMPLSAHTLQGEHLGICLTNHFNNTVPNGQVLIVPLLNGATNRRENPNSTIPITDEENPFLTGTYFAQTSMIQPINRHWITDRIGNINPANMRDVNLSVLESLGVKDIIERIIDIQATDKILKHTQKRDKDIGTKMYPRRGPSTGR